MGPNKESRKSTVATKSATHVSKKYLVYLVNTAMLQLLVPEISPIQLVLKQNLDPTLQPNNLTQPQLAQNHPKTSTAPRKCRRYNSPRTWARTKKHVESSSPTVKIILSFY